MNLETLRSLIAATPECLADGVRKNNIEIAAILNRPDPANLKRVPAGKTPLYIVYNYLATVPGFLGNLKSLADDNTIDAGLQSAAIATQSMFTMNGVENCDLDSAPVQAAIAAFVAVGIFPADRVAGLVALAPVQAVSLAMDQLGGPVTIQHLEEI